MRKQRGQSGRPQQRGEVTAEEEKKTLKIKLPEHIRKVPAGVVNLLIGIPIVQDPSIHFN